MTGATDPESGSTMSGLLPGLRLDELLREVQDRLAEIMSTRYRMQGLLDAFPSGVTEAPHTARAGRLILAAPQ